MLAVEQAGHVGFREFVSTFKVGAVVPLTLGARPGPCEVMALLGAGGMGVVGPGSPFDISPEGRYLVITDTTILASEVWLLEPNR